MEMNKKNRNINLIFRLVTIACFICAVIGIVSVIRSIPDMESNSLTYSEKYKGLFIGMKMHICLTIGTVLCVILSIMSWKVSHYGFVIARTIFLIGIAVFLLAGFGNSLDIAKAGSLIDKFNVSDISDLTEEQIVSSGYTVKELDEIADSVSDIDDDEIMVIILSYISATVVYFVMFFTSITSIIKVQAWYVMAADPGNSPEYYAAMRNNMQDRDLANPYAPVNSPINNGQSYGPQMNGYPPQQINSYGNMQQGYAPQQNGFSYAPVNNMQQDYQGQPVNGGYPMGTMEAQFDAMQQSGAYNNGNYSNQSYSGAPEVDDMDDV